MATAATPVELHVVSDATGETAARLVLALEAQFPDQEFVEIRHPRIESVDDLHLAVNRMKGRPAVVVYTLVSPSCATRCARSAGARELHYCDLLGQPIEAVARVSGMAARMTPGSRPPLNSAVLQADGGDRVRGPLRRRRRPRPARGRHRARRRVAHLEDAALDLPRLPRAQGGERPGREGDRAADGALRDRPAQGRRADDRRRTGSSRSAAPACARWARATASTRS